MAVQWATTALDLTIFGRPFVKRFALCYRIVVCPVCLSATLVYCSQMVGWIKTKLGMEVGLNSGHIVLDGDSAPHSKKGTQPPNFRPMSVVAKWLDGLMPFCMEVGLVPGDFVLDGDQAPPPQKRRSPPNFRPISIVAIRLDGSRCNLVRRQASAHATLC